MINNLHGTAIVTKFLKAAGALEVRGGLGFAQNIKDDISLTSYGFLNPAAKTSISSLGK
jgi:hypothetical protein